MIKWLWMAVILATTVQCCWAAEGAGIDAREKRVSVLSDRLRLDLAEFLAEVESNDIAPPAIDSAWRVDRMPESASKRVAEAERRFGLELAKKMEQRLDAIWFDELPHVTAEAETLLGLAEWVGASVAFGNAALQRMARELALIALGRLAVDPGISVDQIRPLQRRLSGGLNSTDKRRQILNREVGVEAFSAQMDDDDQLREHWRSTRRRGAELRGTQDPAAATQDAENTQDWSKGGFFAPRHCSGSAVECWESTDHELLLGDYISVGASDLDALLRFRENASDFPMVPTKQRKGYPPLYLAFREAWEQSAALGRQPAIIFKAAWLVEAVRQRNFVRPPNNKATP